MDNKTWVENQRQYMLEQAPLRERWLDQSLSEDEREQAHQELLACVEKYTELCPPITGTITYTEEDVKEAKQNGF
jgi:hypothetical protein